MTEVRFYHLQRKSPAEALPEILAKALGRGLRVVIRARDAEQLSDIDTGLWAQDPSGFLPHGSGDDAHAAEQPIWLTVGEDNPNGATMLVLVDTAAAPPLDGYTLCCEVFDGRDDDIVSSARERWKAYKAQDRALSYFQQDFDGRWEKKQ